MMPPQLHLLQHPPRDRQNVVWILRYYLVCAGTFADMIKRQQAPQRAQQAQSQPAQAPRQVGRCSQAVLCVQPCCSRFESVPCRHQHHQPRCPLRSPQSPASSVCSSHSRSCSCQSRLLHVPSSRHSTSPCTQLALGPAPVLVRPQSQRQTSCQGAFTR